MLGRFADGSGGLRGREASGGGGYPPGPMRRLVLLSVALAALLASVSGCGNSDSKAGGMRDRPPRPERVSAAKAEDLPNVIFIYTDDQNRSEFTPRYMPRTFELLADPGTTFSDFVVATPLCCPSRASYLTGSYPHNDGVFSNPRGYSNLQGKFNTLPVWMRNAGYRTAWVGKYLQGYDTGVDDPLQAAPGYDEWHASFDPLYYGYDLADNGESVHYGERPRDYYTSVITGIATDLIEAQAARKRPLYMTINNLAPHHGGGGSAGRCTDLVTPAPRDEKAYARATLPRGPSFNEADRSDKPAFIQEKELPPPKVERLEVAHGCRLASLRGVDRSIAGIYDAVDRAGELSNTVFIFTSDNGIMEGQHAVTGKNIPYGEAVQMPLAILAGKRALGGPAVHRVGGLAANVDFAPTILDLAKAKPCARPGNCRDLDGLSLLPALRGRPESLPADREILIEGGKAGGDCQYAGIRTAGLNYVEHAEPTADGGCDREAAGVELYDLDGRLSGRADPLELDNLLSPTVRGSADPRVRRERVRLDRRLEELRSCSGASCRRP